jgi:ankyrin repeat protein
VNSELLTAIFRSDHDARERLLAGDPELDVLEAAALGREARLAQLLDADPGAIDTRSDEGFRPLEIAAFFGHPGAVVLLLGRGGSADGDGENTFRIRPLHAAAAAPSPEAVTALLAAGADPNVRQNGGFTPLHAAAHRDEVEIARALLAHGADRELAADDGKTAADIAQADGSARVAALLADDPAA